MQKVIERTYGNALNSTFKMLNPIKKKVKKTDCIVHVFIKQVALDILKIHGYDKQYLFFEGYMDHIRRGLVWADQDFKSYHHFYNPYEKRGKYGYDDNALTLARKYYNNAVKYYVMKNMPKSMFYFGAACHMVHDMTVPQHTKGKLFDNHLQYEGYIKENYLKVQEFRSYDKPIIFAKIQDYVDFNSVTTIKLDNSVESITDDKKRFYLLALKGLTLAQRTNAGMMITFYRDLFSKQSRK
jgi:phospholipase C